MHARDAAGRQVSLLNDDYTQRQQQQQQPPSYHNYPPPPSMRSESASPNVPELLRSDSYDSQMSSEPISPLTPAYEFGRYSVAQQDARSHYDDYMEYATGSKRPAVVTDSRSSSYEDDGAASPSATTPSSERPGKRYPCRYRDSHGCEKTFTTSGHASRHSKIHTAEKAVPCTYPGCSKKFTRADNMKQHLETHFKEKSSRPSLSAGDRRSSTKSSAAASSSRRAAAAMAALRATSPLPSPGVGGAWDMRASNLPLMTRPGASRTPSGLDALAMAVACQEGA